MRAEVHVRGRNYAAAERTLQKQLGVIRGGQADGQGGAGTKAEAESKPAAASVRPQYACRLAGTLADVIARGEREAAALGHPSGQDRRGEIVDLLRYAFEACPMATTHRRPCQTSRRQLLACLFILQHTQTPFRQLDVKP